MLYQPKTNDYIEAHIVSVENMTAVAAWCCGLIKGTKLPARDRAIYIQPPDGEEIASVGDVIADIGGVFHVYNQGTFLKLYQEVSL
jgi:hypothetical protein